MKNSIAWERKEKLNVQLNIIFIAFVVKTSSYMWPPIYIDSHGTLHVFLVTTIGRKILMYNYYSAQGKEELKLLQIQLFCKKSILSAKTFCCIQRCRYFASLNTYGQNCQYLTHPC